MERSQCIMGVDINPGSSPLSRRASYSVAIVCEDNEVLYTSEEATLERIVRLAWEYKPTAIATDNPLELGRNIAWLSRLVNLLPPGTQILWVNIESSKPEKLTDLARGQGFKVHGKPGSLRTAHLLASLGLKGLGKSIVSPSSTTRIVVSRLKGHKKGGMSANRFKRRSRSNILRVVKEIKRVLDKNKLDYDLVYRKSGGGLDGAVFNVYSQPGRLPREIKNLRMENVKVEIRPVYRLDISMALPEDAKPIIVGIDPGTTTGLAVIDLEGKPLLVTSRKGLDRAWLIETIKKHGKPVIVATDVTPVPDAVKKVASVYNARLYTPRDPVSVSDKRELVQRIIPKIGAGSLDSHERDALAAALLAYRELAGKIRHIEAYIEKTGLDIPLSRVKMGVLEGKTLTEAVESVISELMGSYDDDPEVRQAEERRFETATLRRLMERIERLEWEKRYLEKKLREKDDRIYDLEKKYESLEDAVIKKNEASGSRESLRQAVATLSREVRNLNEKLHKELEEKRKLIVILEDLSHGRLIAVPSYPTLEHWEREATVNETGIVYVGDLNTYTLEGLKKLARMGVKAILTRNTSDAGAPKLIEDKGIPVIPLENANVETKHVGRTLLVDSVILKIVEEKRRLLEEHIREREKKEMLGLIIEYKENRKRALEKLYREVQRRKHGG